MKMRVAWGRDRRKSQRGAEGVREDGDKIQCRCEHLWRRQQIHFTGVTPAFHQNHKAASLPVTVSVMSHVPEHFYSLKEWIIGAAVEECKDGCVVLSRKVAAPPQVLPQNKAMLLGYYWSFRCSNAAMNVWLGSSAVSSNFAPFGLTDNISNMKLY